jgi:valyl-tRNA synthetase
MLGDTAVAVHPDDPRYADLVGLKVRLPLADRLIPIIADDYADPEKGTGAVKITPAHDFNDFRVGQRHGLPAINVFTPEARLNEEVPEAYRGLDRFVARARIVADLDALGLLDGIDDHRLMVPYDEKSKLVVIEPYLTDQWYVDAGTLAQPAIKAVEEGATVFEPRHWEKTYFEWLRNIEPWCISRQLWWGHRIPAWWGPDGAVFVEETEAAAVAAARVHYGRDETLTQDEDVLDTWFSSALWPFSTLGWPVETEDLKRFYPTHTLATGFDIIFFWVARMMMMGLHFTGQAPFKRVFINALVLDEKGQKMSKTRGNVIDPLELIDTYGADAVRFTLTAMTGQARSIKLSKQRIEGYRNFGTKLWNAARFCQMNECQRLAGFDPAAARSVLNRWIRGEAAKTIRMVTEGLEACAFDDAAGALYRFIWNVFCDWYLELAKPILNGDDEAAKTETRATAAWVLDVCVKLLHPFSPFITEELWDKLAEFGTPRDGLLITARWPDAPENWFDPEAEAEIGWLIELVGEVRSIRAEMNVPPSARAPLTLAGADRTTRARLERHRELIVSLARLSSVREAEAPPHGAAPFAIGEATGFLVIADFIDVAAERARLTKEIAAFTADSDRTARKLANADFLARAPEEVVEENRARLAGAEAGRAKLQAALARLESVA